MFASLKTIQFIVPAAIAAVAGIYIMVLRAEVHGLESKLEKCQLEKAAVISNRETLRIELNRQNEAAQKRAKAAERNATTQAKLARKAQEEATAAQQSLKNRLSAINRTKIPETVEERLQQCETARRYLVR